MRKAQTAPAGAALNDLLATLDSGRRILENMAVAYWPEVVGPRAAAATEADHVRDGVLLVRTRSSSWSQELSFLRETIVTRLNERIGRPVIRELRFTTRGVAPRPRKTEAVQPVGDDLDRLDLPPDLARELQRGISETESIADERLRQAVVRAMSRDLRARWWRLQHGWKECPRCRGIYRAPGSICPICASSR